MTANKTTAPERIARIIRENLSGVTSTDPDIRVAQEDDLMRTAILIAADLRSDLCASGQVQAVMDAATPTAQEAVPTEDELDEAWKSGFNAGFGEAKLTTNPPQPSVSVAEALEAMLNAVCGETGFAACVRHDSGSSYPWPALDAAEEKARFALRALKGDA